MRNDGDNGTHCSELDKEKKRSGPAPSPTSMVFVSVGLIPVFWNWVKLWVQPHDLHPTTGKPNMSKVLARCIEDCMRHLPIGPQVRYRSKTTGRWQKASDADGEPVLFGPTRWELLQENEQQRARIAELEAKLEAREKDV